MDEHGLSDAELARALRAAADRLRYELLLIGERREVDLILEAAARLERSSNGLPDP